MPVYALAKEYSRDPEQVENWNAEKFDYAWGIYVAQNTEKWHLQPDEVITEHPRPNATTLLDHEQAFWAEFVESGKLDAERLEGAGYSASQIPWLEGEMKSLGWL